MHAPIVSPGSYIAVEHTHLDGVPHGGRAAVPGEGGTQEFEQDFTRTAMVMTSYPADGCGAKRDDGAVPLCSRI